MAKIFVASEKKNWQTRSHEKLFSSNTGISLDQIKKELDEAKDKKLLVETSDMIKPTISGAISLELDPN